MTFRYFSFFNVNFVDFIVFSVFYYRFKQFPDIFHSFIHFFLITWSFVITILKNIYGLYTSYNYYFYFILDYVALQCYNECTTTNGCAFLSRFLGKNDQSKPIRFISLCTLVRAFDKDVYNTDDVNLFYEIL